MQRHLLLPACIAVLACDAGPAGPDPEPTVDVVVTAQVNVQLGNTRAGQAPAYIVTGAVTATQGDVQVPAFMDSVVIRYSIADGPSTRHSRRTAVPFSGQLPFTAVAGQPYELTATMYATGTGINAAATGTDEWVAAGIGTP